MLASGPNALLVMAALAGGPALAAVPDPVIPPGSTLVQTWTGPNVNQYLEKWDSAIIPGVTDPFDATKPAYEITPARAMNFVRLYAPNDPANPSSALGSWMMSAHAVRGLTPQQLRDIFALPALPTNIVQVRAPAGDQYGLWTGIAGPIWGGGFNWGQGGAQQTKIIGTHANPAAPPDPARFAAYTWLPGDNYVNGQALGDKALTYTRLVKDGNAGQMAVYLDRFNPDDGTDLADIYTVLDYINYGSDPAALTAALREISPERFDAVCAVSLRDGLIFANALLERGRARRQEPAQAWAKRENKREKAPAVLASSRTLAEAAASVSAGQTSSAGKGLWAQGVGELGSQSESAQRVGFTYHSAGFAGGFDGQPAPGVLLGLAAAGLKSRLDWSRDGGYAALDTAQLGLYAGCFTRAFFLDAALAGGYNRTTARRNIDFSGHGYNTTAGADTVDLGLHRTAASLQDGQSLAAHLAAGARSRRSGWQFSPMARLSYFNLRQNAFDESGAGSLDLHVNGFRAQTLRAELRLLLSRDFPVQWGRRLKPELGLGWAHSAALGGRVLSARLEGQGEEAAQIAGHDDQTDSFLAGTGLSAELTRTLSLHARYEAELGQGFDSQTMKLGLRWGF